MAKHKKHAEHEEELGEGWLLPYADLLTLLLALFIVLYASSTTSQEKLEAMAEAFSSEFGIFKPASNKILEDGALITTELSENKTPVAERPKENQTPEEALAQQEKADLQKMQDIKETLDGYFMESGLSASVSATIDERGLVVSLMDKMLFDSGSATLRDEHKATLIHVAETLNNLDYHIRIEGHTDNVPISARSAFKSNWELSAIRATNVVELFITQANVTPEKITAVSCGEFKPIGDNNTIEGRAQNRRVDIILLNSKFNSLEEQAGDTIKDGDMINSGG